MELKECNEGVNLTKYNTLSEYHDFLLRSVSSDTATTYRKAMDYLLQDQFLIDCRGLDIQKVLDKLRTMKYKNQYSKYKNAFLKFCDFQGIKLSNDILLELQFINLDKVKKRRKLKQRNLKDMKNKIKVTRDTKLKLSYEMLLETGLRVSELSNIKKEDCEILSEKLNFSIVGKGQQKQTVSISKKNNPTLFSNLLNLIADTDEKVFYSRNYLQMKAIEKGFACHDLRRAHAKLLYEDTKDINQVMQSLRHKNKKTTEIYLKSKINIDENT